MPFTLSHPAAVLPLARRPFVVSGLVIGSMAPDVPYFLKLHPQSHTWYEPFLNATETHHWPGMFVRGLPLAGVMLAIWWLVEAPMREFWGADRPVDRRLRPIWLLVSIGLGIATHVGWDRISHLTDLLRDASTVIGLAVVAWWIRRRWIDPRRPRAVLAAVGIAVLLGLAVGMAFAGAVGPGATLASRLRTFVEGALVGMAVPALVYAAGWRLLEVSRSRGV